jgi:hypothetical protein
MYAIDNVQMAYAKFTVTDTETVVFPAKYTCYAVKGDDVTVSLTENGESGDDGVLDTADFADNVALFTEISDTDTLYITGSGDVQVWGGFRAENCPFRNGVKGGVKCLGTTTTELTDGSTVNPITIDGKSVTAKRNDIAFYDSGEFMFNGTAWSKFGDLSGLGDLAYKDTASGSYTPAGSVSVTQSQATYVYDGTTGLTTYTEAGAPSATFTGTMATITVG